MRPEVQPEAPPNPQLERQTLDAFRRTNANYPQWNQTQYDASTRRAFHATPTTQSQYENALYDAAREKKPVVLMIGRGSDGATRHVVDNSARQARAVSANQAVFIFVDLDKVEANSSIGRFASSIEQSKGSPYTMVFTQRNGDNANPTQAERPTHGQSGAVRSDRLAEAISRGRLTMQERTFTNLPGRTDTNVQPTDYRPPVVTPQPVRPGDSRPAVPPQPVRPGDNRLVAPPQPGDPRLRPVQPTDNRPVQPTDNRPAQPTDNRPVQPTDNRPAQPNMEQVQRAASLLDQAVTRIQEKRESHQLFRDAITAADASGEVRLGAITRIELGLACLNWGHADQGVAWLLDAGKKDPTIYANEAYARRLTQAGLPQETVNLLKTEGQRNPTWYMANRTEALNRIKATLQPRR